MLRKIFKTSYVAGLAALNTTAVLAQEAAPTTAAPTVATLSTVEIRARAESLDGVAAAASEGVVSGARLSSLPLLRPAEVMEMVPGMVVTQHAGDGKANQYFLRGYNLDHGTDFATYVNGVPVNMPTHAHGQGYTDLGFLIPELVERIAYRKGPYHAEEGDFSSAGAARIDYARTVDGLLVQQTLGQNRHARTLLAGSPTLGSGHLLYGLELYHNDGPWEVEEHYRKFNGVLRYSEGERDAGWAVTAMAYRGRWTSTDQIPERAIDSGAIDRYGSLDPTAGGVTHRYSLSGEWARQGEGSQSRANVWVLQSALDLWSNFSYCASDPDPSVCATGDQFKQAERRQAGGFAASHAVAGTWVGYEVLNTVGVQGRHDRLSPVGLYLSSGRKVHDTVREDEVRQSSLGLWVQNEWRWTPWLRSIAGLRGDAYRFDVDSDLSTNSGQASDAMVSPKLGLVLGPWSHTEVYLNYGHGFHSNDARGTTIRVDPADGVTPVDRVQPLVRTRGQEVGLRSEPVSGWSTTIAVWELRADSELVFVGDAGATEASRPSRRYGVEWSNYVALSRHLALDADLAWAHARFTDSASEGDRIPGAVEGTANLGVTVDALGPWSGALRLRYVGPRPLIEDNSVRSKSSALLNLRLGYQLAPRTDLGLDIYNLLNRQDNDIEYWYESQLKGEAAPVEDRHLHPTEPRTLRLTLAHRF
jgi:outer membrane receptor protein involved in Fe transport